MRPAFARPRPETWDDTRLTVAWLGHATVLINFYGVNILTDPALFSRVGIRGPGFTIGPKRLTVPALRVDELPRIDLVLLSHAHFDHFDRRTLRRLPRTADVVTAARTADLLRGISFHTQTELRCHESTEFRYPGGALRVEAIPVKHWGARMQYDNFRGYNGYILERNGVRVIFGGDSAMTDRFAELRGGEPFALAIMAIGAYDPWIRVHATPGGSGGDGGGRRRGVHHAGASSDLSPECGII